MRDLIENVMDFARGRLGAGLSVSRRPVNTLAAELQHVIDEQKAATPERVIESELRIDGPVFCDSSRIAQLVSNLVANALVHGDAASPVQVRARTGDSNFELWVSNQGKPIPAAWMSRLFQPFARGLVQPGQQGLGLGLYIASQIAQEHDGTLQVWSSSEETRFTFRMPWLRGA